MIEYFVWPQVLRCMLVKKDAVFTTQCTRKLAVFISEADFRNLERYPKYKA